MENDRLFEFMEKMYSEMQQNFKKIDKRLSGVDGRLDGLENEVKKNSIKIESLEKKLDTVAEIQKNHINQNENNHTEIVEMLSDRIDLTQQAVQKLSKVK